MSSKGYKFRFRPGTHVRVKATGQFARVLEQPQDSVGVRDGYKSCYLHIELLAEDSFLCCQVRLTVRETMEKLAPYSKMTWEEKGLLASVVQSIRAEVRTYDRNGLARVGGEVDGNGL